MIKQPEIEKTLVISTGHIKQDDMKLLENKSYPSTVIKHPNGHGTIIHVSKENTSTDYLSYSSEFQAIILEALLLECCWINFDCDGENYPELPTFDW